MGNDYVSYVRLPKSEIGVNLYIASYSNDTLVSCEKTSEYTEDDTFIYLQNSLHCEEGIDSIKSFLWYDDLEPITMCTEFNINYLLTESFETTNGKPS